MQDHYKVYISLIHNTEMINRSMSSSYPSLDVPLSDPSYALRAVVSRRHHYENMFMKTSLSSYKSCIEEADFDISGDILHGLVMQWKKKSSGLIGFSFPDVVNL